MTEAFNHIVFTLQHKAATLTLNRARLHNAFDDAMLAELLTVLTYVKNTPTIHVLTVNALGKSFSAGADAAWMQRMSQYSYDENIKDAGLLADVMEALANLPQTTLAVVQGSAFGGGVGLIACCDIAIAAPHSEFCLSEVKLGLIPAVISPYLLRSIGLNMTQYYALTAERFSAARAQQMGLIHEVVEADQLALRANTLVTTLLGNAPKALVACKRLLKQLACETPLAEQKNLSIETIARLRVSPEGQEGLNAFLQKRIPQW
jgi:methylglutaconyl-CoA hydratase